MGESQVSFKTISEDEQFFMTKAEIRQFQQKNSFESLPALELRNFKVDMTVLEKVLNSQKIIIEIPDYISGRATNINV